MLDLKELAILSLLLIIFIVEIFQFGPAKSTSYRPVVISWWLPWLGNALAFGRNPHKFLEKSLKRHGPAFTTLIAGRKITFLLDPTLVAAMFRNSPSLDFGTLRAEVQERAFAMSHEGSMHPIIEGEVYPNAFRHFSKSSIALITSIYSRNLLDTLLPMHKSHANTSSISLWGLVFPIMYNTSSKAIFGKSFPEATLSNFAQFDQGLTMLAAPLPSLFIPRYHTARTAVIAQLVQWMEAGTSDPEVFSGTSQLVKDAVDAMKQAELRPFDSGAHLLSLLWGSHGNTMWTSFWYITFLLQDPTRIHRLRAEIQTVVTTRFGGSIEALAEAGIDVFKHSDFILLESGFQETMRLASSIVLARRVVKDISLYSQNGRRTQLIEGDTVFVTPRNIHMNKQIYTDPESFQLDRFVADDGKSLRHFTFEGKLIPNHILFWGGGAHMCKGIHIATYEVKLFVTLMIYLFDMEFLRLETRGSAKLVSGRTLPKFNETCSAVMHTDEDIVCNMRGR